MNNKNKNSFVCFLLITYEIQKKLYPGGGALGHLGNVPDWSMYHVRHILKFSSKSIHLFVAVVLLTDQQTNSWKHNLAIGWSNKTWGVASDNYTHTYTESGHRDNSPATRGTEDCLTPQPQLPQPVGIIAKEYINESWSLISSSIFGEDQPYLSYTYMHVLRVAHAPGMPPYPPPPPPPPPPRFQRKLLVSDPSRTCRDACRDRLPAVTGKTFPAFPAHTHPQFYVSGKRPMA